MHSNENPDRTTSGLSTEDLAQSSGTNAGGQAQAASPGAPIYPGESTAPTGPQTPSGEPAAGAADTEAAAPDRQEASPVSGAPDDERPQLLTDDEERVFRDRWQEIQNKFVDDPRQAVDEADALVADVMQTLATTFAQHKKDLEGQWGHGDERADTEELRGALRRYRSFFNRLLTK